MKIKFMLACLLLSGSIRMFGQQVTEFMGIPVDGTKKEMIQKLQSKGFDKAPGKDLLIGNYLGEPVYLYIHCNNDLVWKIEVADINERNADRIKNRFNNICSIFEKDSLYINPFKESQSIKKKENILYEKIVSQRIFSAVYYQNERASDRTLDSEKILLEAARSVIQEDFTNNAERLDDFSKENREEIISSAERRIFNGINNRFVKFRIYERVRDGYVIIMLYENKNNKPYDGV